MLTAIALDDERPALDILETFAAADPALEHQYARGIGNGHCPYAARRHPSDFHHFLLRVRPGEHLRIHRAGGKPLTVRMTMKELRALLPAEDFVRIHRSYIVRLGAVTALRGKTVYVGEAALSLGGTYERRFRERFRG